MSLNNRKVYTGGTFDLFHTGHVNLLRQCKEIGDYVVVSLNTDEFIYRYKGEYPIISYEERKDVLLSCKYVDEVVVYATETELLDILRSYPIDVRIVGDEYADKEFTGKDLSMKIYYNRREHSFSTTELRGRVIKRHQEQEDDLPF